MWTKARNTSPKIKPKKPKSVFLLSEDLRQTAKDAKKYQEITKKDYKKDFKATFTGQSQEDHKKSFLGYGKKSFQRYNGASKKKRPLVSNSSNSNNFFSSSEKYQTGRKYSNETFVGSTHN